MECDEEQPQILRRFAPLDDRRMVGLDDKHVGVLTLLPDEEQPRILRRFAPLDDNRMLVTSVCWLAGLDSIEWEN